MELNIKAIGYKQGTSGWLKDGLQSGKIQIKEGVTKDNRHGLWIKTETGSACLAIYDEYQLAGTGSCTEIGYNPVDEWSDIEDDLRLTPASSIALKALAQSWCETVSEERESDDSIELALVRVSAE